MIKHLGFTNQTLLTVKPTPEIRVNAHSCVNSAEKLPSQTYSSILESVSSLAELHWKRRIALAAKTEATKANSEVCSTELSTVTESTVPIIVDKGFESENGEVDHHTSDNTISESLSVVDNSVDIPDVINVGVDIPKNNTCGELPKCHDVVEVHTKEIECECDFCPFVSTRVKEFHKHLREVHDNICGDPWNYSLACSGRLLPKVTSKKTAEQPRSLLIKQADTWEEMCNFLELLPRPKFR